MIMDCLGGPRIVHLVLCPNYLDDEQLQQALITSQQSQPSDSNRAQQCELVERQ